jgi:hypothetical protein
MIFAIRAFETLAVNVAGEFVELDLFESGIINYTVGDSVG